jgi:hypothetical protein
MRKMIIDVFNLAISYVEGPWEDYRYPKKFIADLVSDFLNQSRHGEHRNDDEEDEDGLRLGHPATHYFEPVQ